MATVNTSILTDSIETGAAPRFLKLDDWLSWQESLHFTAIELGLDRCRLVAERMSLLEPDFKIISVAGTNGKGSSVTMLDMILTRSGYLTGKYTSPHLLRYNERICINEKEVSDEDLCQAFERVDGARGDVSLTYFEFGTLAALELFKKAGVDVAIMEVGLGGRLDAVNILDPDASLITSIDVDHENWLGYDRDTVGREKAGIMRTDKPAVCSDLEPPASVLKYALDQGVHLDRFNTDYDFSVNEDAWDWTSGGVQYKNLFKPNVNNDCQIQNAAGVLMLLRRISPELPVEEEAIYSTMRDFRLNGRFQIVPAEVPYILDVAHNRESAQLLVENLNKLPLSGRTHCVLGLFKDKHHELIFSELNKVVDRWYVSDLDSDRAEKADILEEKLKHIAVPGSVSKFSAIDRALDAVNKETMPGDRIVITGSFLTVRAAILRLRLQT